MQVVSTVGVGRVVVRVNISCQNGPLPYDGLMIGFPVIGSELISKKSKKK